MRFLDASVCDRISTTEVKGRRRPQNGQLGDMLTPPPGITEHLNYILHNAYVGGLKNITYIF